MAIIHGGEARDGGADSNPGCHAGRIEQGC